MPIRYKIPLFNPSARLLYCDSATARHMEHCAVASAAIKHPTISKNTSFPKPFILQKYGLHAKLQVRSTPFKIESVHVVVFDHEVNDDTRDRNV